MTIKLYIPQIVFDPELGNRQEIRIFLNEKNELKLRFISKESLASPEIRQLLPMITISAKEEIG